MAEASLSPQNFFEKHREKIALAGPNDCWLWTASTRGDGYGGATWGGRTRLAHRVAYETVHGDGAADGFVVRHRCDVPLCVNPSHLEIGTPSDNVRDRNERGRQAKGEAHGNSKLTEADVRAIRAAYIYGSRTHGLAAIARTFGVRQAVVGKIIRRELWAHVS